MLWETQETVESHYGLVLALQVHIPEMGIDLVHSSSSFLDEDAELQTGLFCISLSDLQTTLAIDEDIQDMRSATALLCYCRFLLPE